MTCTRLQDPAPGSYGVPGVAGEGGSSGLPPGGRGPSVSACPVPEGIDQGPAVWWEVAAWHLRQMYIVKYDCHACVDTVNDWYFYKYILLVLN